MYRAEEPARVSPCNLPLYPGRRICRVYLHYGRSGYEKRRVRTEEDPARS